MDEAAEPHQAVRTGWMRWTLRVLAVAAALVLVAAALLNSPIGRRFVADSVAGLTPASGLRVEIGRIDGSLFSQARLHDVVLSDPAGPFLLLPDAQLDWRPLHWFSQGLDIRKLSTTRGTLLRLPKLRPGNPDAPILPNFDIRIDQLRIERLTIAKGVLGAERRVDLAASADIRKGRAFIRADGKLGGQDRLFALLDAEPARDRFDIKLDYNAPKGGLLAGLTGVQSDLRARITGKGAWRSWDGSVLAEQAGKHLAAFQLSNRAGQYGLLGQAWPSGLLTGLAGRAAGEVVSVDAAGTFAGKVLRGRLAAVGAGVQIRANGGAALASNAFDRMLVKARITNPGLLGEGVQLEGAQIAATLDGPFRALSIEHTLSAARLVSGKFSAETIATHGTAKHDGAVWSLPLDLTAARIITGNAALDPRLVNPHITGTVTLAGSQLASDDLGLSVPGVSAKLALRGDTKRGGYALAGPVAARDLALPDLGLANADAKILAQFGKGVGWSLRANFAGRMARVDNATLTSLAGDSIRMAGGIRLGAGQPLLIDKATLDGSKLSLAVSGRRLPDGRATIIGSGRHVQFGQFTVDANLGADGPHAALVFADPLPAAGLKDVHIALSPIPQGFRIETKGDSRLGPFAGILGLFAQKGGPTRLAIDRLDVWKTAVTGSLLLAREGLSGDLVLAGGGVDGTIALAPRSGGQGFTAKLAATDAHFGGDRPITISSGTLEASGLLHKDHSSITGNVTGQGIGQGSFFIGRLAASARLEDGRGRVTASLAGRRGSRFNLQVQGDIAPQRLALLANGDFAGQRISMPRRAVLTAEAEGWRLAQTQLDFGGGRAIASGIVGNSVTDLDFALADMPLSLADVLLGDLGLGGKASGIVTYRHVRGAVPSGGAQLQVKGLTRSGLVLTSRPVDLALVAALSANALDTRAVVREGSQTRGRMQGRITGLPAQGTLGERLRAGSLFGQIRYDGPADALWRLIALEVFDLTGPISVAADLTGTVENPQIRGSLASDNLHMQSALTGTDISGIGARGRFAGSRLEITSFAGRAANGGMVSGSGSVDLSGVGTRGPAIDLRLAASNAQILARDDMAAVVTGPMRIISDGVNGTIAGRLSLGSARWQLGRAAAASQLPNIQTREINRRADIAPPRATGAAWRFLIDASGQNRIDVRGLGLDSEWSADIHLRGTTAAPAIQGRADLVRGGYEFAGKRFEMTRGRISFDGGSPPDPRLDIAAEAQVTGLTARVTVSGTSLKPVIAFSSIPALPEDELLSRLLFGNSITQISAPEALQLAAALEGLRGGGGLDPINKLRSAIGLDRLRIVGADSALGRSTGVAVGKYLGRRFYAEIITDGRGYSATQIEFRVSSWLSLLGSVSTIGRQSVNARVSKDY